MNKRKILESARKLAQKGSKEKALAEYQKLLKLDPKDAKLRLEIGDAHRRWGQVDQAVETYTRVAEQYMNEGFDARAVAVFKQILNLAPDRFDAYGPLAELYERMGLTAEAIGALQTAADGYHRQGRKDEALDLLRKMANVDPSNTTSRIKVADLLRQQGKSKDAIAEYQLAAEELERQGDAETVGTVYRRILEVDETHVQALARLAGNLASRGKVSEAVPLAERAAQLDDANPDHYELLADLFDRVHRPADRERALRGLAEVYRQRGDEDRARDILQRFVSAPQLAGTGADELSTGGADPDGALFGSEFPDTDGSPEFSIDFGRDVDIDHMSTASARRSEPLRKPQAPVVGGADEPEELLLEEVTAEPAAARPADDADVDQLLAEATVYLRYGKRDKAIAHLERIVGAEPDHRAALEKLGEAFAENGENERAVEVWLRAARAARDSGDEEALRVLRGRIAVLDDAAAQSLGGAPASAPADEPGLGSGSPLDELEFDAGEEDELLLDDDELLDDIAASDAMDASSSSELDLEAEPATEPTTEPEIEIDVEMDLDEGPVGGAALDEDGTPEIDVGEGAPSISMDVVASKSANDASLSAASKQQVLDDLEEADFYMQQGLHDEAYGIYQRVLSVAPNHPRALLRLGEIAAARGEAPASTPAADEGASPIPDLDPGEAPEAEEPITEDLSGLSDLDLDAEDAIFGDPNDEPTDEESSTDGSDTQELRPGVASDSASPGPPAPAVGAAVSPPIEGAEGDFDLAAALSDAFDDDPGATGSGMAAAADDGFEAVFNAFKKGVRETLGDADHQAHYDLAIAYKEMGLLDDAINELRTAMADPGRTAECLHLIGLCAIDADQAPLAIEHLEQLLTLPDLDAGAAVAARFDLGRALEALGDLDGARREWESVAASHPDFQDVTQRLAGLGEPKVHADAAGFESFDDVMEGFDDAEADASPGETFEDLMAEVSDEGDTEEAVFEGEPIEDIEPESEPDPAATARPARAEPAARRKKKKISFL